MNQISHYSKIIRELMLKSNKVTQHDYNYWRSRNTGLLFFVIFFSYTEPSLKSSTVSFQWPSIWQLTEIEYCEIKFEIRQSWWDFSIGLCCFVQRDPVLYLLMLSEKDEYNFPRAFSLCTSTHSTFLRDCKRYMYMYRHIKPSRLS